MSSLISELLRREGDAFFDGLAYHDRIWREVKKKLNVHLAGDFSVFDYIQPNENALSRIIADLLDPEGAHGQDATFLKLFLAMLRNGDDKNEIPSDEKCDFQNVDIVCEALTTSISNRLRRIDIRISLGQGFGIGIENKPWAEEQKDQLADYWEELRKKYGGNFLLCYLCPGGAKPKTLLPAEQDILEKGGQLEQFKILYYSEHFCGWLEQCIKETQADKVRWFLKDFLAYIQTHIPDQSIEEKENDE